MTPLRTRRGHVNVTHRQIIYFLALSDNFGRSDNGLNFIAIITIFCATVRRVIGGHGKKVGNRMAKYFFCCRKISFLSLNIELMRSLFIFYIQSTAHRVVYDPQSDSYWNHGNCFFILNFQFILLQ